VVATGTPEHVAGVPGSYTGEFLQRLVEPEEPRVKGRERRRRQPVAA
jgi:excinuclease ABC subunit A